MRNSSAEVAAWACKVTMEVPSKTAQRWGIYFFLNVGKDMLIESL